MVYVVATRGKLLKGTSREQTFLQKRPVAIKHFCERDQSRSQITTSNYILEIENWIKLELPLHSPFAHLSDQRGLEDGEAARNDL